MNIKNLRSMSKNHANKYRTKSIEELEHYMEEYNTRVIHYGTIYGKF